MRRLKKILALVAVGVMVCAMPANAVGSLEQMSGETDAGVNLKSEDNASAASEIEEGREVADIVRAAKHRGVSYASHVQGDGWQAPVTDGEISGTTCESRRLEALWIRLRNPQYSGGIKYRAHVQSKGWQSWVKNGKVAGTNGEAKRLEAVQIKLTGKMAKKYDVWYRVHAEHYGWMGWSKNGRTSGTIGCGYRVEAIQVMLIKKGGTKPSATKNASYNKSKNVGYTAYVEGTGWQDYVYSGSVSGTMGQQKKIEAVRLKIDKSEYSGSIKYRSHVQNLGWQKWVRDGAQSGTTGESKRLEAIEIKLTGEMGENYDVHYRVHCQSYGWMAWQKNGQTAGTIGESKRVEAIQVFLVPKGTNVEYPEAKMVRTLDPKKPMIAITYDDGPYSPVTDRILNALESTGSKATFFVVGNRISSYKSSVVRADKMGCQIANHTWDHKGSLTGMNSASITSEISRCNTEIQNVTGKAPTVMRPVGGGVNATVRSTVDMPMIIWSVDTLDWKNRNANSVYNAVVSNARDGDIILLHDIHPTTAQASERFIPELVRRGYQLVTVDELAYYKGYKLAGHNTYNALR